MAPLSYPPYTGPTHTPTPLIPSKPLLPLLPPPAALAPSLPPRPDLPPPPPGFRRSLHAAPAAYPRTLAGSTGTYGRASEPFKVSEPRGDDKKARAERAAKEIKNCVDLRYMTMEWTIEEAEKAKPHGLWIAAERWVREEPKGGVTLVCTHANGLPKEQWHPVIRALLARPTNVPAVEFGTGESMPYPTPPSAIPVIDEIWFLDDVTHGMSLDLNAGLLGGAQSWLDTGRDALNFVDHILPTVPLEGKAGYQLGWEDRGVGVYERRRGREVYGVGHSFGATGFIHAAAARPGAFAALFCVESTCPPHHVPFSEYKRAGTAIYPQSTGALRRRGVWPTLHAFAISRKNPFYASWADDAWQLFLTHGLVPVDPNAPAGTGEVALATPPWCEAAVFTEPDAVGRGWDALLELRMPVGFVMCGDDNPVWTGGKQVTNELVWRPKRSRNERIAGGGHLLVQEKPDELAECLYRFLATIGAGEWDKAATAAKL